MTSDSFEVTPDQAAENDIWLWKNDRELNHQELVKFPDLCLSLSLYVSTRLSCGETEGGQVRKTRLLKITQKAASFAHSGACGHSFDSVCIFLSLLHLLKFVLGRAPGNTL